MSTRETVSLCLIARNEEDCILACINSARHLVDEIIVVDTGSYDQTAALAVQAGAKLFHYPWAGDFAAARNFALQHASSGWVLILDADEELEAVDREDFQRLLFRLDLSGYFLTIKNYLGTGAEITWDQAVRLFRNNPLYRFVGAIHEQAAPSILKAANGQGLATAPLVISHYGYLDARISNKDKYNRNARIIEHELERTPADPFLLYCLGLEYYQQNKISKGLKLMEKALPGMHGSEGYFEDTLLYIALGLLHLYRTEKLIEFAGKCQAMFPQDPKWYVFRGLGYLDKEQYPEALEDLTKVLQLKKTPAPDVFHEYLFIAIQEIQACLDARGKGYEYCMYPANQRLRAVFEELALFLPACYLR